MKPTMTDALGDNEEGEGVTEAASDRNGDAPVLTLVLVVGSWLKPRSIPVESFISDVGTMMGAIIVTVVVETSTTLGVGALKATSRAAIAFAAVSLRCERDSRRTRRVRTS